MAVSVSKTTILALVCGVAVGLLTPCTPGTTPTTAKAPSASPCPSGGVSTPTSTAAPTPSVAPANPTPSTQTVKLDINQQFPPDNPGSYSRVTPTFTVADGWNIAYSFNCDSAQGFGFVVTV